MPEPAPRGLWIPSRLSRPWREKALAGAARLLARSPAGLGLLVEESALHPGEAMLIPSSESLVPALGALLPDDVVADHEGGAALARDGEGAVPTASALLLPWRAATGPDRPARLPACPGPDPSTELPPLAALSGGSEPGALRPGTLLRTYWWPNGDGRLRVRLRLFWRPPPSETLRHSARVATAPVLLRLQNAGFPYCRSEAAALRWWTRWRWRSRAYRSVPMERAFVVEAAAAAEAAVPLEIRSAPAPAELLGQTVLFGATGSGKSATLLARARDAVVSGTPALLLDVHGDLGPRFVADLPPASRDAVVAIDLERADLGIPGLAVFGAEEASRRETETAHLVAALKRLASEGGEIYWGFRIERVLDAFVRIAEEQGGTLLDLYELLTDARRREAARVAIREPALRRFLEELPELLRRNPEFLWPATARVAKVAMVPALTALLSSPSPSLDTARLLSEGRSVCLRIPFGSVGPEAAAFAASLVLTRTYLSLVESARGTSPATPRALLVIDEAHSISPRLLTEILSEGRKFGVAALLATQYPDRLTSEVRAAAAGAAGNALIFRTPFASAPEAGRWAGLSAEEAGRLLPSLPAGMAVEVGSGSGVRRRLVHTPPPRPPDPEGWEAAVRRTALEFGASPVPPAGEAEERSDALLLALLGRQERGECTRRTDLLEEISREGGTGAPDGGGPEAALARLIGRRWVEESEGILRLTDAGERRLGLSPETGAVREGEEHRRLLLACFRIFARNGERLEIVRQGRFDVRLPDGRLTLLSPSVRGAPPARLLADVERASRRWAWRYFSGRDVHVEAEVSRADRTDQILRGLRKARREGAVVLYLVSRPDRARRIRACLARHGVGRKEAMVWTLPLQGPAGSEPRRPGGKGT